MGWDGMGWDGTGLDKLARHVMDTKPRGQRRTRFSIASSDVESNYTLSIRKKK